MTVQRARDLHIRQEYDDVDPSLHSTNRLWDAETTSVPNVVCPHVESRGAGRLALWRRRRHMKVVTVMPCSLGETYSHIFLLPLIHLNFLNKMHLYKE